MKNTKAEGILKSRKTSQLIEDFILTGKEMDAAANDTEKFMNLATVRGWLMDELKERNPEAYEAWLDDESGEDEDLRKYFKAA